MRIPSEAEYIEAKAALAVYGEFCKPYVQRNGWTVIPADAPRPEFNGVVLDTDRINAYSTNVELYDLANNSPERFSAYVVNSGSGLVTWTGEPIGKVVNVSAHGRCWKWRQVTIRADWGQTYTGREYVSTHLVNLRRVAA